jgi:hypothetical protein
MPPTKAILDFLEEAKKHKDIVLPAVDARTAYVFLAGFLAGCGACGLGGGWRVWRAVARARGWKDGTREALLAELQERGMSPEEAIDELIAITAAMVRQVSNEGV